MYGTGMNFSESAPCKQGTDSCSTTLEVREEGNRVHKNRLQLYEQVKRE